MTIRNSQAMKTQPEGPRRGLWSWLVLALLMGVLTGGLYLALMDRFETGEQYAVYSSFRSDPSGTRMFFEVLEEAGVQVERSFLPLRKLRGGEGKTLIISGFDRYRFDACRQRDADALHGFAMAGGRVVLALEPPNLEEKPQREERLSKGGAKDQAEQPNKRTDNTGEECLNEGKGCRMLPKLLEKKLKLRVEGLAARKGADNGSLPILEWGPDAAPEMGEPPLWFGTDWLVPSEDSADGATKWAAGREGGNLWRRVAMTQNGAAVVERMFGNGSVVVCADRHFLSNESLWMKPATPFLAWLLGNPREVIFDEVVQGGGRGDEEGVMTLARRYGMHGLFVGGMLVFGLWMWRSMVSLVPQRAEGDRMGRPHEGRSLASGMESLLMRGIERGALLRVCFETWEKTRSRVTRIPEDRVKKARGLLEDEGTAQTALERYSAMCAELHAGLTKNKQRNEPIP